MVTFMKICKWIGWLILLYVAYALVGSTLPWIPLFKGHADKAAQQQEEPATFSMSLPGVDRALLIEQPHEAYNIRMAMLRGAESSLDIVYYAIQSDNSGEAFLGEVLRAADRGVPVRILVDGKVNMSARIQKSLRALDAHPNISCKQYNPVHLLKPWRWHALLHNKIILVDGTHLLTGGRNIGDRFFDVQGYAGAVTYDRDVFVTASASEGSVLREVQDFVERLWTHEATQSLKATKEPESEMDRLRMCAAHMEEANRSYYTKTLDTYMASAMPTNKITLIANPIHTGKKEPVVGKAIVNLAENAEDSVIIQTPYATANRHVLGALSAIDASAETILLTNSIASSPNFFAFSNYYSTRGKFLKTGVDIFELQSKDSMHGKSIVIDHHLSVVGSLNLDDRSLYIDTENMLVIDSEPFAAELRRSMDVYQRASLQVDKDGGYLPGTVEALQATLPKRAGMVAVSVISRLFQFLI